MTVPLLRACRRLLSLESKQLSQLIKKLQLPRFKTSTQIYPRSQTPKRLKKTKSGKECQRHNISQLNQKQTRCSKARTVTTGN